MQDNIEPKITRSDGLRDKNDCTVYPIRLPAHHDQSPNVTPVFLRIQIL